MSEVEASYNQGQRARPQLALVDEHARAHEHAANGICRRTEEQQGDLFGGIEPCFAEQGLLPGA